MFRLRLGTANGGRMGSLMSTIWGGGGVTPDGNAPCAPASVTGRWVAQPCALPSRVCGVGRVECFNVFGLGFPPSRRWTQSLPVLVLGVRSICTMITSTENNILPGMPDMADMPEYSSSSLPVWAGYLVGTVLIHEVLSQRPTERMVRETLWWALSGRRATIPEIK